MPKRRRATGTPRRRTKGSLEDLPVEVVVDQILVRLPSKDVGRCRVVSKSWLSATSTPRFMLEHRRRQPSLPIVDKDGRPATFDIFRDGNAGASNKQLWSFLLGFKNSHEYSLHGACDGFLMVRRSCRSGSRFYIYNPVTRKHALLPQPQVGQDFSNAIISFYRHRPTGEYRVLWVSRTRYLSKSSLYVLTVGSDDPRHVTLTMPAISSPPVEHNFLWKLCASYSQPPVHHCGSLHWGPYEENDITGGGRDIIVFDTEAESFRWMRSPNKLGHSRKLFDMNGTLAFWHDSTPSFTAMDVWVMQDYEAEIWHFKYRIDVSMVEASRQIYLTSVKSKKKTPLDSAVRWFNDMAVLNERELLMRFNTEHVLRCDIDGKFLGPVNLVKCRYPMLLTQHRLQESIAPIPCPETQEGDEESPFSTWYV